MDRLTDGTRIKGKSRMIPDNTPPDAVNNDHAQAVIDKTLAYIQSSGISRTLIARSLGIAASSLGQVLNWKYAGQWQQIIIDLDRWLEQQINRDAAPATAKFVWTKVANDILAVAKAAVTLKTIGLVYGPETSGMGKTLALEAICEVIPGTAFVSAEKVNCSPSQLFRAISKAMRKGDSGSTSTVYNRVKAGFAETPRLLIIDQAHSLCGFRDDLPLFSLIDLFIATKSPQLWCGTADINGYLQRGTARGKESLAQISRRFGVKCDLMQRVSTGGDDGRGEPLYTVAEIRAIYGKGKMRLAADAAHYLCELANLPGSGALGTCTNLVLMATTLYEAAEILTADMLRKTHKRLMNSASYTLLESSLAAQQPQSRMKVG
jgi:hypothetical protein